MQIQKLSSLLHLFYITRVFRFACHQKKTHEFLDLSNNQVQIQKLSCLHFHSKSKNSRKPFQCKSENSRVYYSKPSVLREFFKNTPNSEHAASAPQKNRPDNSGDRIESQFQSLMFSFMGWASLFYGVCFMSSHVIV